MWCISWTNEFHQCSAIRTHSRHTFPAHSEHRTFDHLPFRRHFRILCWSMLRAVSLDRIDVASDLLAKSKVSNELKVYRNFDRKITLGNKSIDHFVSDDLKLWAIHLQMLEVVEFYSHPDKSSLPKDGALFYSCYSTWSSFQFWHFIRKFGYVCCEVFTQIYNIQVGVVNRSLKSLKTSQSIQTTCSGRGIVHICCNLYVKKNELLHSLIRHVRGWRSFLVFPKINCMIEANEKCIY